MGLWLAVTFVKFGSPIIFADLIESPGDILELAMNSWHFSWAYFLLGIVAVFGLCAAQWRSPVPKWVLILPLVWFGWQLLSARQTIQGPLTQKTLLDFAACTVCFYLGIFALGHLRNLLPVWCGLLLGLAFCLWTGWGQHFGGLEQTRRYVESIRWELYPPELKARLTSPEFQQKIASNRIFGTFVYPNALAGGILFALPVSLAAVWNLSQCFSSVGRGVLTGLLACAGLVCLFWSGSKAGWLIMLGMALLAFVHLEQLSKRAKLISVLVLMTLGCGVFYAKHAGYFTKKTNSATARLDYWQAAWQTMKEKPLFGSGPGTFMINYQRLKRPESEPAKLADNYYLQQGSDSGVIGLCTFLALMGVSVVVLYCRLRRKWDWGRFAVWLGVAGLAVQEFVEFSLYIPALAWPLFLFLGWLWAATELPLPQPPGPTAHA